MKNLSTPPAWDDTPRTNALIQEIQSTPIPFEIAFWRLLELTRILEVENIRLKQPKKPKAPLSRLTQKKRVARKMQGQPKAKMARKS